MSKSPWWSAFQLNTMRSPSGAKEAFICCPAPEIRGVGDKYAGLLGICRIWRNTVSTASPAADKARSSLPLRCKPDEALTGVDMMPATAALAAGSTHGGGVEVGLATTWTVPMNR